MRLAMLIALGATFAIAGCKATDASRPPQVTLMDLPCSNADDAGVWESAPWRPGTDDTCLAITETPAWVQYSKKTILEVEHGLGRAPRVILVYVALDETGEGGSLAAGDQARLHEIGDVTFQVENATEQDYWARFVLH